MGQLAEIAKRVMTPQLEQLNSTDPERGLGRIARAYVYKKNVLNRETKAAEEKVIMHLVLSKGARLEFEDKDLQTHLVTAFGQAVGYHMSYENEMGPISDAPADAEMFFSVQPKEIKK